MTHQAPLFCESLTDAIRDVVRACGGTKVVGCKLWPEKNTGRCGAAAGGLSQRQPARASDAGSPDAAGPHGARARLS